MKKVALVFVMAVLVPSMILAWLAVRSLRDQQFLIERQQSLICQGISDSVAKDIQDALSDCQREFSGKVAILLRAKPPLALAPVFDTSLRTEWPMAEVGFGVTLTGEILSPSPNDAERRKFLADNSRFLANRESAEVYLNPKQLASNSMMNTPGTSLPDSSSENTVDWTKRYGVKGQPRSVTPQQALTQQKMAWQDEAQQQFSKLAPSEAEFRQLIGDADEGTVARFVDNKLNVLFWYRPARDRQVVFGALLSLPRLEDRLAAIVRGDHRSEGQELCIALLDDMARPVALSKEGFEGNWRHPFVATEIGEALPHWEIAVYLLNPAKLSQLARNVKLMLGLLIALLVFAIGMGSWLIVADLNRQLTLARQKTDFVSNVSHELKTPLTSIRMFSELLAEGHVTDPAKQQSYLGIITAETARLTRLITNVLDFARMERGEKQYHFQPCDLSGMVRETVAACRPQLEAGGFDFTCEVPDEPMVVHGDRDALSQVVLNLLSNAEKYVGDRKEVRVELGQQFEPLPFAELRVMDRGLGVPPGSEEKIFEKFYRAHDALSSGIQGSGLGLTLARQIARAHGGELSYKARERGGSCFTLRLPLVPQPDPSNS